MAASQPPSINPWIEFDTGYWRAWIWLVIGIALILFAESIARDFAEQSNGSSTYVDTKAAERYTLKIYLLGGVSTLVGLVERITITLKRRVPH